MSPQTISTEGASIQVSDLARNFGETEAVRGVSFTIRPGELYGLVGADGAGKTTTVRLIAGLLDPDAGSVRVLGHDPRTGKVRERVGLMPQQYSLYGDLSVGENMQFFSRLFCIPRAEYKRRADRLLGITRLGPFIDRRASALSGGMYKKLALSCALLHEPDILLLDEPTNGVDPVSRRELWDLLYEFVGEGMAVLVCTPYMDEASRCHRVGLMNDGKLLDEGIPGDMVRRFEHETFLVEGGERAALHALLEERDDIISASPAGPTLRVVVQGGHSAALADALAHLDARLVPARPEFEDLYLARMAAVTPPAPLRGESPPAGTPK